MTLPSWPELHGAVTHFPVAMLMAAFLFDAGATVLRKREWETVAFWMLAVGVAGVAGAIPSGLMTAATLFGASPTPPHVFLIHRAIALCAATAAIVHLVFRISRRDDHGTQTRAVSLMLGAFTALCVSIAGYLGGAMALGGAAASLGAAPPAPAAAGAVPAAGVALGQKLFASTQTGCRNCHKMDGLGGTVGPDLTHEARRHDTVEWHIAHLTNPSAVHPGSMMPSFSRLKPEELKALSAYLASRK
ncbi:MAG TPA: DUF2231 domain-containing protein [Armatimonadota bacterium]|jgi:uncharacterized membrane protein